MKGKASATMIAATYEELCKICRELGGELKRERRKQREPVQFGVGSRPAYDVSR